MVKYLIMNADDFGLSDGINRGIIEAHQDGILTSTTWMANTHYAEEAINMWKKHAPELGLGLHITLSYGAPISDPTKIPSLVQADGKFCSSYEAVVAKSMNYNPDELAVEIHAQLNRFVELVGQPPDHLDSHHHATYFHLDAYQTLIDIANQYQIPIRRKVTLGEDHRSIADKDIYSGDEFAVSTTDYLDLRFYDQGATHENLATLLENLRDGSTEIMCHPGYADEFNEIYNTQRERELGILISSDIKAIIEREGIQLINFADLP